MATKKPSMVSGVFRERVKAQTAYDWLLDHGYSSTEVNVLMSDKTRSTYYSEMGDDEGRMKVGTQATEGVAIGGAIGTAVGASIAAIMAIGTSIALPGLGLIIAGPLAAALAGGGAGAVAGGAIGGLVGLGIPESNVSAYEKALRDGGVVVGVLPHTDEEGDRIKTFFEKNGAENVCYC